MTKGPIPFRPSMAERIKSKCDEIAEMLIAKNAAYGDSATNPVRIFSRASTTEQLKVRMDDKLSRLARGHAAGEDTNRDLIGYGVLLLIAEEDEAALRAAPCEVGSDLCPEHGVPLTFRRPGDMNEVGGCEACDVGLTSGSVMASGARTYKRPLGKHIATFAEDDGSTTEVDFASRTVTKIPAKKAAKKGRAR